MARSQRDSGPGRRRSHRIWWLVPSLLLLMSSCGRLAQVSDSAEQTATAFDRAIARHDWHAACALLAPSTFEEVEQNSKSTCDKGLSDQDVPAGGGIRDVQVWGRAAQVVMQHDVLFLTTVGSGWKITAAACSSRDKEPYQCSVKGG